jgi:CBS domain-containing protein
MAGTFLVRDVMSKDVKGVGMTTDMQAVINMMIEFDISSIIILQGKTPVGIVTHKDVLERIVKPSLSPMAMQAKQIMTTPITSIDEEASVEEAAKLMAEKGVKKLPAIKDGELTGIITSTDLIRVHPKVISVLESVCGPSPNRR